MTGLAELWAFPVVVRTGTVGSNRLSLRIPRQRSICYWKFAVQHATRALMTRWPRNADAPKSETRNG